MPSINVQGLSKTFPGAARGGVHALNDVSFSVGDGELVVLVGPSGCGKTTTIRCIAGLESPTDGRIELGERVVVDRKAGINVPIERRDVGMVFQNYALWPHMTARKNIEFPLRSRRVPAGERRSRGNAVAESVQLTQELLEKIPAHLSGGQQQRVALARALVGGTDVVLFDEPLSNLDAALREYLRIELKDMHNRLGFSGIYVTHDLTEAMVLGDRVVVMSEGHVEQFAPPADVFERPVSVTVARLVGMRPIAELEVVDGTWRLRNGQGTIHAPEDYLRSVGDGNSIWVQPDHVELHHTEPTARNDRTIDIGGGTIRQRSYLGSGVQLIVDLPTGRIPVVVRDSVNNWEVGAPVWLRIGIDSTRSFAGDAVKAAASAEPDLFDEPVGDSTEPADGRLARVAS